MPNVPPQLTDLINSVLTLLQETADSAVAQLDSTVGGSTTITTAQQITTWLNDGCADLVRRAYPLAGTVSLSSQTAQMYSYADHATADGGVIWYARSVTWNGVVLTPITRTAFERWFPTWETDSTGTPLYWFRNASEGIGIYPAPASSGTLGIAGYEIPPILVNSTDTLSAWLPDHLTKLPIWYAANMVALQNDNDMSLKNRSITWQTSYDQGLQELQTQIWQADPTLARALWGVPLQVPAPAPMPPQNG